MFGLVLALAVFGLLILLPLTTSARLLRVSRELEELRERLSALEGRINALTRLTSPPPASAGLDTSASYGAAGPPPVSAVPPVPAGAPEYHTEPVVPDAPEHRTEPQKPVASIAPEEPDLEEQIGGRWLLYTGVLVLLIGVSFFLKYAFDNAWIDERGRVVLGAAGGVALIAGGWRSSRHDLRAFGQALIGTGLAILYLSTYAALSFYALIDETTAFALMIMVTLGAALLADGQRSQALALIAVGGGFLTPFLVGGRQDAQITLFSYDALLVGGTLGLASRHQWLALNAVSYILTGVTILAWAAVHYTEDKWLRTLLFLTLFCAMFVQILRHTRRAGTPLAAVVAIVLTTAPVFYHIAAVVLTARHPPAIHIYLIAFTAVGLLLTADPHRPGMRLLLLAGSYLPLFGTMTLPEGLSWITPNTVTIVSVAALNLMAILDRVYRQDHELQSSELVGLHITMLGLYGLLYRTLEPAYPEWRGGIGAVLAIVAIGLWQLLRSRDRLASLNACALAFTLTALAIAVQFDGPAVVIGWAAEGATATWIGLRARNAAFQAGGFVLLGLAILRLLDNYFVTPAGFTAIVNERTLTTWFVVVLAYLLGWVYKHHRDRVPGAAPSAQLRAGRTRAGLHVVASLLTMMWMTAEVKSYWAIRYETPQAYLYEQLIMSLAWAIYGAVLIIAGMWRAYPPDRYIGITVLAVTILKVFLYDLWELGGIYRVIGFVGFGALLVAVSYLYQRKR